MTAKPKILISCQAQNDSYRYCRVLFEMHGCTVTHAPKNGHTVCAQIRELQPVVALMDVFMPGCDAISVMEIIRRDPAVSAPMFIVYSSFDNAALRHTLSQKGCAMFFSRPLQLEAMVNQIVAQTRALQRFPGPAFTRPEPGD